MTNWIVLHRETDIPLRAAKGGGIAVGQDSSPHGKPRWHLSRDRIISKHREKLRERRSNL